MAQMSSTSLSHQAVSREGCREPRAVTVPLDFAANADYQLSLNQLFDNGSIDAIVCMYVNNRVGAARIDITISGTSQVISCPAGMQGYFPVIAPAGAPTIDFRSTGGQVATLHLLNYVESGVLWTPGV